MDNRAPRHICPYEVCSKAFGTSYNLNRHIRCCHLNVKQFECELCKARFSSKQSLVEHKYIHSGEKPFACQVLGCHKRYRQSSQLSVHKRTHRRRARHEDDSGIHLPRVLAERRRQQRNVVLPLHPLLIPLAAYCSIENSGNLLGA